LLAGTLWLVYPPAMAIATWITAETAFTALLLVSVLFLCQCIQHDRLLWGLAAGLALGAASLMRGTCVYFPLVFLIVWWAWEGKRGLQKGACLTAGLLCVVLPWFLRNLIVLDEPILIAVGAGSVFLQGSDESCFTIAGKDAEYEAMYEQTRSDGWLEPADGRASRSDSRQLWVGLHNYWVRLRQRPLSLFFFTLHKGVRLWYGTETGGVAKQIGLGILSLAIVPLAILQIGSWWRSQPGVSLLLGSLLAYFVLLHWVTLPQYRYMHPIYPLLILAACEAALTMVAHGTPERISVNA